MKQKQPGIKRCKIMENILVSSVEICTLYVYRIPTHAAMILRLTNMMRI